MVGDLVDDPLGGGEAEVHGSAIDVGLHTQDDAAEAVAEDERAPDDVVGSTAVAVALEEVGERLQHLLDHPATRGEGALDALLPKVRRGGAAEQHPLAAILQGVLDDESLLVVEQQVRQVLPLAAVGDEVHGHLAGPRQRALDEGSLLAVVETRVGVLGEQRQVAFVGQYRGEGSVEHPYLARLEAAVDLRRRELLAQLDHGVHPFADEEDALLLHPEIAVAGNGEPRVRGQRMVELGELAIEHAGAGSVGVDGLVVARHQADDDRLADRLQTLLHRVQDVAQHHRHGVDAGHREIALGEEAAGRLDAPVHAPEDAGLPAPEGGGEVELDAAKTVGGVDQVTAGDRRVGAAGF